MNPQVAAFRAKTIAVALELYAKTGIKVNRAYTPTAMLAAAAEITGQPYKRGQYVQAAADIHNLIGVNSGTQTNP